MGARLKGKHKKQLRETQSKNKAGAKTKHKRHKIDVERSKKAKFKNSNRSK